jgi:hypothetical protein
VFASGQERLQALARRSGNDRRFLYAANHLAGNTKARSPQD